MKLLKKMADASDGVLVNSLAISAGDAERHERHQLELLSDEGLVSWDGHHTFRITLPGYEALEKET